MASEFAPIRPVHRSWRGRPVPEDGDDAKRARKRSSEEEAEPDGARDGAGLNPDDRSEDAADGPSDRPAGSRARGNGDGAAGRNVDEYA